MTDKTNKIDNNVKTCKINEIDIIDLRVHVLTAAELFFGEREAQKKLLW